MSNTKSSEDVALPEGYEINGYTIKSVLGQGGFGITYLANDSSLERDVAIKEFMPRTFATRSEDLTIHSVSEAEDSVCQLEWGLERFVREARTLSKFDNPNIVRVHTVFEANNTAYMVMSYEKGSSFQEKLREGKPSEEELTDMVMGLLNGLEAMHAEGFIHRDIKPGNIFIRADGTPLLLDFGSARQAMGEEAMTLTKVASPGYAPFEQYYGRSDMQGPWTDIYAMGATLYRAVTGEAPVDSTFRNRVKGEEAIQEIVDALDKHNVDGKYSPFFLRAIEHAIRTNHKERPQSVEEWRQMLTDPSVSTVTQWRYAAKSHENKKKNGGEAKKSNVNWKDYLIFVSLIVALSAVLFTYFQNN